MNPTKGGWLILLTLLLGMLLGVVHFPETWPNWLGTLRPNWLLLIVFFWVIELPHRIGLIAIWLLGFAVDALLAAPLGTNGLILAGVTYIAWRFFERLRMYSVLQQCGVVFLLVMAAEMLRVLVQGITSERQWGVEVFTVPLVSMLAWPFVYLLLLRLRTGMRVE